ncbi:MAG TPA: hypothetical protein PKV44_04205 [Bacillota bacterium]|nr:hypothetical protein [Bacillota bacterium]HPE38379.1 hypothetical protein [Bacillota bacterium]
MKVVIAVAKSANNGESEVKLAINIANIAKTKDILCEVIYLPYYDDYCAILDQIMAYRLIPQINDADLLITIGYPAFALQHPNKISFLYSLAKSHHDQWDTDYGKLCQFFSRSRDEQERAVICQCEKKILEESKRIFVATEYLRLQLAHDLGLSSEVADMTAEYDMILPKSKTQAKAEFITATTYHPYERVALLLEALSKTQHPAKLYVISYPGEDMYRKALISRIERLSLSDRVIIGEPLSAHNLLQYGAWVTAERTATEYRPEMRLFAKKNKCVMAMTDSGAYTECLPQKNLYSDAESLAFGMDAFMNASRRERKMTCSAWTYEKPLQEIITEVIGV